MTGPAWLKVGGVYGRLMCLVTHAESSTGGNYKGRYRCECGTELLVLNINVRTGNSTSCGCYRTEVAGVAATTHGMSESKIYGVWCTMLNRCYKPSVKEYANYGARGIEVCDEWHQFENFYADMGDPPSNKRSVDRIDVNGHYSMENCRWATSKQQMRNTRATRWVEWEGRDFKLCELAEWCQIEQKIVAKRLERGWTLRDALTKEPRRTDGRQEE